MSQLTGVRQDAPLSMYQVEDFLRKRAMRSKKTATVYREWIWLFTKNDPVSFLQLASTDRLRAKMYVLDRIEEFVLKKNRGATISTKLAALISLCDHFEIVLPWKNIKSNIPRRIKPDVPAAPREAVKKLWDYADLRGKVILSIALTGARVGAYEWFTLGDFKEIEVMGYQIGQLTIYRGEAEEYPGYLTPEGVAVIKQYLELRRNAGEKITDRSPIVRHKFDRLNAENAIRIDKGTIQQYLQDWWLRIGYPTRGEYDRGAKGEPRGWAAVHGIRKCAETELETVGGMKHEDAEKVLGHKYTYRKPRNDYMEKEWVKAAVIKGALMMSDEWKAKIQLIEKDSKITEMKRESDAVMSLLDEMKARLEAVELRTR
jgi:integrase